MTFNTKDMLKSILSDITHIEYVRLEDIPNIDLYMDQVTTFMEEQMRSTKRHDEDKILTKTMINNYAKNNLLPPPVKKKYSKEHILALVFIYYFKNILSLRDIETLLNPLTEKCFDKEEDLSMASIYEEICRLEKSRIGDLQKDVARSYCSAMDSFVDMPEADRDFLQLFAFICSLSFDVYIKKLLIEKLIDGLPEEAPAKKKK